MADAPTIVAGVDLTQRYTPEDILDMYKTGRLRQITNLGYCTQGDESGTLRFVPYYESNAFRVDSEADLRHYTTQFDAEKMRQEIETEHPILRRTPQERAAAMTLRILAEMKKYGTVPGIPGDQLKRIIVEHWKVGQPVTEEAARRVAQWYLGMGEVDNKEADRHRVTRAHPTA
jgi:hypothetical protein